MGLKPNFLTPKQLAERWCILTKTLADQRFQGRGPAYVKIGQNVRYRLEDIEAWEQRVTTSDQQ